MVTSFNWIYHNKKYFITDNIMIAYNVIYLTMLRRRHTRVCYLHLQVRNMANLC